MDKRGGNGGVVALPHVEFRGGHRHQDKERRGDQAHDAVKSGNHLAELQGGDAFQTADCGRGRRHQGEPRLLLILFNQGGSELGVFFGRNLFIHEQGIEFVEFVDEILGFVGSRRCYLIGLGAQPHVYGVRCEVVLRAGHGIDAPADQAAGDNIARHRSAHRLGDSDAFRREAFLLDHDHMVLLPAQRDGRGRRAGGRTVDGDSGPGGIGRDGDHLRGPFYNRGAAGEKGTGQGEREEEERRR